MARENEFYQDNLALLNEMFPETAMLNIKQAAAVFGYKRYDLLKKKLPFKDNKISKATLARCMCPD